MGDISPRKPGCAFRVLVPLTTLLTIGAVASAQIQSQGAKSPAQPIGASASQAAPPSLSPPSGLLPRAADSKTIDDNRRSGNTIYDRRERSERQLW